MWPFIPTVISLEEEEEDGGQWWKEDKAGITPPAPVSL